MQCRAAIWILEAFYTSPSLGIKAIASLVPIYLHLQKLCSRFQLRTQSLLSNYIIKLLMESRHLDSDNHHQLSLEKLTLKQQLSLKSSIVDTNNRLNRICPLFIPFSFEFSPGD